MTNLLHGFIYFSTAATEQYNAIGLADTSHYFASRAAPMGPVPAEVVVATFFNFNPDVVRLAIPAGWEQATPAAIQDARLTAAGAVLDHIVPDEFDAAAIARCTDIAAQMCDGVGYEGKPLAAANRSVALPGHELTRLWQLITIIREWRGDAHIAALGAAPVTAVESLILHAATGQVPEAALRSTRGWSDETWDAAIVGLVDRGLTHADGSFTDTGAAFRTDIEDQTDVACHALVAAVDEDTSNEFVDLLRPLRAALLSSDVFPAALRR